MGLEPALKDKVSGKTVILIAGPTASGKSALALRLAQTLDGVIVNADSMQVYNELRILTARPSAEDEARAPHRLYGHRPAAQAYSVAAWLGEVAPMIAEARRSGPPLIVTGGTGLYFKALLEGLSPVPGIPEAIRAHWRSQAAAVGAAALHDILRQRDPEMAARLSRTDPQRIARALEVLDATGLSLSQWQRQEGTRILTAGEAATLYVSPPREALYARCDVRLDAMAAAGALDEVRQLSALRLDPALPAMRALGVRPFLAHLAGTLAFGMALEQAKTETRNYSKRQLTWARRNMIAWTSISTQ